MMAHELNCITFVSQKTDRQCDESYEDLMAALLSLYLDVVLISER